MDHRVSKDMISSGMTPSGQKSQSDLGRTQYGSAPSPRSLMDAYHSMYVKEKEETLDEGKIPAGLQAYLDKKKGKKGKKEVKEGNINELKTRTMLDYIDKASDSASKELGKAEKTTSGKKEAKARLKMDKRERGIEMAKGKIMKRVEEDVDLPENRISPQMLKMRTRMKRENPRPNKPDPIVKPADKPIAPDLKPTTSTQMNDVDLFDLVKGKLIDEGIEESDAIKLMVSATEEQLQQIVEMDRMGGPAAIASVLGAGAVLAKKGIDAVKNVKNKIQKATDKKNQQINQLNQPGY